MRNSFGPNLNGKEAEPTLFSAAHLNRGEALAATRQALCRGRNASLPSSIQNGKTHHHNSVSNNGSTAVKTALVEAVMQRVTAHYERQNLAAAREFLMLLDNCEAHNPETLQTLGNVCCLMQDYAAARKAFEQALEQSPNKPELWLARAVASMKLNDDANTEQSLKQALALDPHNVDALKLLADWSLQQRRHEDAAVLYGKLIEQFPNQTEIFLALARCFFELGDKPTAISALERVLELDPANQTALDNLKTLKACVDKPKTPPQPAPAETQTTKPGLTTLPGCAYQSVLLPLDYPPSRALKPRWGHGNPPHQGLVQLFSRWTNDYTRAVEEMRSLTPYLEKIRPDFTQETSPEAGWVGGPVTALDLALLYYFVWKHRPATYVEIGSGVTTCFARRAINDHQLGTRLISIDPEPRASINAICDEVVRDGLETLSSLELFSALQPGDIVFMDGSHRSFMNSDVTVFMLDVLPLLKPGVLIHFHDIHLPCDYDPFFVNWYWNEQYILAAHLLAADRLKVLMPSYFVANTPGLRDCLRPSLVPSVNTESWFSGGSIWFTHDATPKSL